ncbi:MAG: pilus assembly protein TadG-related protein [Albidovulum sp.]
MSGKELPNGMRSIVGEIMDHCKGRLGKFRREEDGSLLIFGLFCLVMMMFLAGAALDLMRYEERRTTLQNTVDRAVLAAADLRQTLPPKEVVKDYFRKAGLKPPSDNEIVVNQGTFNEWRTVQANVSETMPTWFMRMVDIKSMTPIGAGTAEERVGQVEISLVLDVSGSMNSNNRLTNLKPAAKAFIDQMFDTVEPGKLSISLITYSTQVSAGPQLLQYFDRDANSQHNKSSCLEFNSGDFNTTAMYPSGSGHTYRQNGHFDPFYRTSNIDSYGLWNCPKDANEAYRHTLA